MKGRNPIVIGLVTLMVLGGAFAMFMGESEEIKTVGTNDIQNRVSLATENVDGDRLPQEFKKLVVDLRDMQGSLDGLNQKIETLEQENTTLKNTVESVKEKNTVSSSPSGLEQPDEQMFPLPTLNSVMDSSNTTSPLVGEIGKFLAPAGVVAKSVGEVTNSISMKPLASEKTGTDVYSSSGMIWLEPMDAGFSKDKKSVRSSGSSGTSPMPSMLAGLDDTPPSLLNEITSKTMSKAGLESSVEPMFTLPNGSVITNSMSVTAMVGRIPVNGQITDPWRFKISTGASIVMPNDHELQGLEKMIIQGDAVGDLNLSCVTGRIDTMTFIFNDGRIVTKKTQMQSGKAARPDQYLGYISDKYANPCIPGKLITNAPQAITQMGLLGVAAGMADGIAEAETQTTVTERGNIVKNVVGDQLKYAGYKGVASGVNDIRGWFATRMGQYFDVIYVKAGQVVDVHITQEIKLDYDPMGRKVRYEKSDDDHFGYMD